MSRVRALRGLLLADARRIARDRFLLAAAVYFAAVAVAVRWVLPWAAASARARWGLDLEPYFPLIVSYVALVMGSVAVGIVGGFILLELREERSIVALRISPLPLGTYVHCFSVILALLGATVGFAQAAVIGLGLPSWGALATIACMSGPGAPLVALYLATYPENKLEGFAHMKFVSIAGAVPLGAYFLPAPWQYFAGVFPPFWSAKAWWSAEAGDPSWPLWLALGTVSGVALVWVLSKRLETKALVSARE
jgi:fluoroquinolone transport system permease protein